MIKFFKGRIWIGYLKNGPGIILVMVGQMNSGPVLPLFSSVLFLVH